jgi:hypothetical protein
MQGLASECLHYFLQSLGRTGGNFSSPTIDGVTEQRVSDMRHVDPYLVGSTGLQLCQHVGMSFVALDNPVVGTSLLAILANGHPQAVDRVATDRLVDQPSCGENTLANRLVLAVDIAPFDLSNQIGVRL